MANPSFFEELKRRHVWRVAVAYAVAGWLLIQVATQVFPFFDIPNWSVRLVVVLIAIGFPVAMVLAWAFEITPDGVRRTVPAQSPNARAEHDMHSVGRKLNAVIISVLIAAVALLGWRLLVVQRADAPAANVAASLRSTLGAEAAPGVPITAFDPPAGSIVVLPFANLSDDPKQQYFSNGVTEELTNALGQNTGLTVIAWNTASKFANSKQTPKDIGQALNVAHVLAGSIQREGDAVRVTTELVNTANGRQLWSAHYDDSLTNIFAVQDKISAAIAQALKVRFASASAVRSVNPAAHDLVLKARALMNKARTAAPVEQARKLYGQAIALDPDYADAHAGLADAWYVLTALSTLPLKDALPKLRAEASRALALDPRNVRALIAFGNADETESHLAKAKSEFERALEIDPSNADAHLDYGNVLPLKQSLAQELEAVQLDPDNATAQNNLAANEEDTGEYAQALAPMQAMLRLDPHSADSAFGLALVYALLYRNQDAVQAFDLAQPDTPLAKALVAAGRLTYQSLLDSRFHAEALAAVDALRRRSDIDPNSMSDVLQLYLALGRQATALDLLPKLCAAQPIGCSDISVNPLWLPLRGQPRFETLVKQYDTISKPAAAASAAPGSSP